MNIRDENVLKELNLYPLWVRRNMPAAAVSIKEEGRLVGGEADTQQAKPSEAAMGIEALNPSCVAEAPTVPALSWPELKQQVRDCTACSLRAGCTQTVFGVGDENAEWLFVGEGPGEDEDAQGEPFVGPSGKLLDNMLAAIKLKRGSNVYIANVIKCHPPENRVPHVDEIVQCLPYLQRQIALIKPKLIVALGKTAATALLGKEATLGSLRGTAHDYHGVPLIITYHPAYLLRMPAEKAHAWDDLRLAMDTMQKLTD